MYLVLGGAGQLAQAFSRLLCGQAVILGRAQADLTQRDNVRSALAAHRPKIVLNCAAYNQVDKAESDSAAAWNANALGPATLADECRRLNAFLVHFSTNYVFGADVARRVPYGESDLPGALSVYAATKLAGEHLVQASAARHLVLRTCGLYGARAPGVPPSNFVATMLRLANQGKPIRVVNDQICTPTFTDDLARATLALIDSGATGLFHMTNRGECSWHEFARTIFQLKGLKVELEPIPTSAYPTPAQRPAYSVLDVSKYESQGLPRWRPWQEALADYLQEAAANL